MKRALLIPLAIVVALPVAGLAVAHFTLNENALRTRIETAVQKATGRDLTIAGPIHLGWSLTPTVDASDLSLANPPGFSRAAMVHIDRIEAKIGLLPLLSHRLEVNGLTIAGPNVLFERNAQGRPNWEFSKPAPAEPSSTSPSEPTRKLTLDIGEVAVTDATLAFQRVELTAPHLTYDPNSRRVAGDLAFRGVALHVTGSASSLNLQGNGLTLAIAGAYPTLTLSAEAVNLASLSDLAGTNLPALRDVRLAAKATVAPASLAVDDLTLTTAQGDVAGNLVIAVAPRPSLRGALRSTRFDLDALTPPAVSPAAAAPTAAPTPPPAPGKLIPDTPIPYAALRGADADLQLDAAALAWHGRTYPKIVAHLVLQDGTLHLDPATMAMGDKTLSAQVQADAATQTLAARVDAPGVPAGPLSTLIGGPANASGNVDLHADLHGQGATWHEVVTSLRGNAGLAMVDGDIDNAWLLDKLQGALRAANLPLVPGGGDSKVRCAAVSALAESGKLQLQALTLDTTKLELEGAGTIDLADETLDLHLRPTLRLGAALSVPVHVGGSLRAPKIVLDPGALAPGRVGISIGGPPPPDPCGPALALARGGQLGPAPAAPEAANRPLKPADLLRSLLR